MDGPRRLLALAVLLLASAYGADAAGLLRAPPTGYKYNATFTFTGEFLVLLSCMGPANGTAAYGHGGIIHSCTLDQLKVTRSTIHSASSPGAREPCRRRPLISGFLSAGVGVT